MYSVYPTSQQIAAMLQMFLHSQQQREERLEKEAQHREHKYQTLQHQFLQLQSEVEVCAGLFFKSRSREVISRTHPIPRYIHSLFIRCPL